MTDPDRPSGKSAQLRPTGHMKPDHQHAVEALTALEQQRLSDARYHIDSIPDTPIYLRAWKTLLDGQLHIQESQLGDAESLLLQAAAMAFIGAMGKDQTSDAKQLRLCACALHDAGRVLRRRDRPDDACQTHQSAYHLREQHGSYEELWETIVELGLDADLARRYEDAQSWYRKAIDIAGHAEQDSRQKQAITWTHLSNSFAECDRFNDAVDAARTARDCWVRHDASDVSVARADLTLGSALLKFAACLHEQSDDHTGEVLEEAMDRLNVAHESLLAFGPDHATDARWCAEQQQFAETMQSSLVL